MSEPLTLDLLDKDGAIRDALDEGSQGTRAELFRRAVAGGGTVLAGGLLIGGLPSIALGRPSAAQDVEILNFALLLEHLEADLLHGGRRQQHADRRAARCSPRTVRDHALAHVASLARRARLRRPSASRRSTSGDTRQDPEHVPRDRDRARSLRRTAYNGQGTRLNQETLAAAATIASVEARHAAWVRQIHYGPYFYNNKPYTYPAPSRAASPPSPWTR